MPKNYATHFSSPVKQRLLNLRLKSSSEIEIFRRKHICSDFRVLLSSNNINNKSSKNNNFIT